MGLNVEIHNIEALNIPEEHGSIVTGTVDGEEHLLFRRVPVPHSGGTSQPASALAREFADDYVLYKAAESELEKGADESGQYLAASAGNEYAMKFSSVKIVGPNLVEVKGTVDGEERSVLFTGDDFKQRYHQAVASGKPNFFLGSISSKFLEKTIVRGLDDYLGQFTVEEDPHPAEQMDAKNFAQAHISQHPTVRARTAAAAARGSSRLPEPAEGEEERANASSEEVSRNVGQSQAEKEQTVTE